MMEEADRQHVVEVQVDEEFEAQVPSEKLQAAAETTLIHAGLLEHCELTVVVTTDAVLHELNLRYREIDAPTDVLSFANEPRGPYSDLPGQPHYLGDVVVSCQRAAEQAQAAGHPLLDELQVLVVHGVLHLLGHDHAEEAERVQMWRAQAEVLVGLGVEPPELPAE